MPAFNPTNFKLRYQLTFEGSWPTSIAFLGSGRKLAAGNQLGQIFVWDLPEAPPAFDPKADRNERQAPNVWPVRVLDGHSNEIRRLLVTPDGKSLMAASLDHTLRIWPVDGPVAGKVEVVLDPDTRQRIVKRTGKKDVLATPGISVDKQTECAVLKGHKDWINAFGMSADGKRAISGDAASQVIVWDLAEKKQIAHWSGHAWNGIVAAALSPDGQSGLVSEYRYKRDDFDIPTPALKIWNVAEGKEKLDLLKLQFPKLNATDHGYGPAQVWAKFVANGMIAAAYSADGKLVAVGQGGETEIGKAHLLDTETGKLLRDVSAHPGGMTDLLFSADGKYLLTAGRDTTVRVCQIADGKEVAVLGAARGGQFKDWLSAVALSPDQRTIAATDIAGIVQVWELGG
jgi:WD40 repeat protein